VGSRHSVIELEFVQASDSSFALKNRAENLKTGPVERKAPIIEDYLSRWVPVGVVAFVDLGLSVIVEFTTA
jgi:hypothetical protein